LSATPVRRGACRRALIAGGTCPRVGDRETSTNILHAATVAAPAPGTARAGLPKRSGWIVPRQCPVSPANNRPKRPVSGAGRPSPVPSPATRRVPGSRCWERAGEPQSASEWKPRAIRWLRLAALPTIRKRVEAALRAWLQGVVSAGFPPIDRGGMMGAHEPPNMAVSPASQDRGEEAASQRRREWGSPARSTQEGARWRPR